MALRRARGVHYTPPDVAAGLVRAVWRDAAPVTVCDPSCGAGSFLLAAAEHLERTLDVSRAEVVERHLWGADIDPDGVAQARQSLVAWAAATGPEPERVNLAVADTLRHGPELWPGAPPGFDLVIGNPPFLGQLRTETARSAHDVAWTRRRFGAAARSYTDTALLFLLAGLDLAVDGGRVAMVLPTPVMAASAAGAARAAVLERAAVVGAWLAGEAVFDAAVHTWAVVLEPGARQPAEVSRWSGRAVAEAPPLRLARGALDESWGPLFADLVGTPAPALATAGTLGERCGATAGFRDEYYGLVPHVAELSADADASPVRLVTSGLIDPAELRWGTTPARFARRSWRAPVVDLAALRADGGALARWGERLLVPKVLLAAQTRVPEAVVDTDGSLWPSVPVVAVVPHDPADLWHVAAVLSAPPVAALVARRSLGGGLSRDAVRLPARQVLELPLPEDGDHWNAAARWVREAHAAADPAGRLDALCRAGAESCAAYGLAGDEADEVLAWWRARLASRSSA